jgi:cyclic pyranopterin phosphate synthase
MMRTVDVSLKPITLRLARAYGRISLKKETVKRIREGTVPKGDVLSACKVAGLMAVKKNRGAFTLLPSHSFRACGA